MKHVAAYLLAQLGGNSSPDAKVCPHRVLHKAHRSHSDAVCASLWYPFGPLPISSSHRPLTPALRHAGGILQRGESGGRVTLRVSAGPAASFSPPPPALRPAPLSAHARAHLSLHTACGWAVRVQRSLMLPPSPL